MTASNISAVVHSTVHEAAVQHYELTHQGSPHMSGIHAYPARLTRPGPERAELLRRPIVAG